MIPITESSTPEQMLLAVKEALGLAPNATNIRTIEYLDHLTNRHPDLRKNSRLREIWDEKKRAGHKNTDALWLARRELDQELNAKAQRAGV